MESTQPEFPSESLQAFKPELDAECLKFIREGLSFGVQIEEKVEKKKSGDDLNDVKFKKKNLSLEIGDLHKLHEILKSDCQGSKMQQQKPSSEVEVVKMFGWSYRERNERMAECLVNLEKTKSLSRKIIRNLLGELESNMKKADPLIEADALQHLVDIRLGQSKNLEHQVNREVQRIEKAFEAKWTKSVKAKLKYERIDWKLRTKIHPKIVDLERLLFDKKNKLANIQQNLEDVQAENEKESTVGWELENKFEELEGEFDETSSEMTQAAAAIKQLKAKIFKTAAKIEDTKKSTRNVVTELNENQLACQHIQQLHAGNLKSRQSLSHDATVYDIHANDCIIDGIRRQICRTAENIRAAKIQKAKLRDDVEHLLGRGGEIISGCDYMGSVFVKTADGENQCQ